MCKIGLLINVCSTITLDVNKETGGKKVLCMITEFNGPFLRIFVMRSHRVMAKSKWAWVLYRNGVILNELVFVTECQGTAPLRALILTVNCDPSSR